ncbi:hypothetical protein CASFOL_027768 [Castilleja foliolosa]|uniref:F-box domain-containing protein n=1 Tax=Castilleja foliolosa TaxID=1961234 RepID=A0ABD3CGM4_9LAMI
MSQKRRKTIESSPGLAMADCFLPLDMMLCIFTRLPVKSIHRFKSVCKPLRDVLSSPEFAKMHRAQFPLNPENQSVIVNKRIAKHNHTISMLKIDSDVEKKPILSPQVYYIAEAVNIIGCFNGLICMDFLLRKDKRHIALWNPALNNMSMCLPEAGDFKVIIIADLKDNNKKKSAEVYSSNSNSWSRMDVGFQFVMLEDTGTTVNGSPYWEASVDGKWVLVCFDVREMVFKIVPRPKTIQAFEDMLFVDWKGDLGAIMWSEENDSLDVWVFNDVGNIGWTKKCSFGSIELNALNVCRLFECWKDGKIITGELEDEKLFMFDTENGVVVVDEAGNEWWSDVFHRIEYVESLVYISKEWKNMEWKNYSFLDAQGLGAYEGRKLDSLSEVEEEIELAKIRIWSRIERILEHDHQTTSQSSLTLHFNKVSREILTGEEIKGESNTSIELNLVDDSTGNFLDTGPQASGSIEIVLLKGESDDDSVSEFKENYKKHEASSLSDEGSRLVNIRKGGKIDKCLKVSRICLFDSS